MSSRLHLRHGLELPLEEVELRTSRSSGPGGQHANVTASRVEAVFDAYIDHADMAYQHGFRGCGLLNAAAELPAGSPGRELVRRHKEEVEQILRGHLGAADLPADAATRLARHLSFLLEGAMSRAGLEGGDALLHEAKTLARSLVGESVGDES